MSRQEKIDYIEGYVGTLSSMPWNELDDEDLMKLWGFILGIVNYNQKLLERRIEV